jgi:hypothetical protein
VATVAQRVVEKLAVEGEKLSLEAADGSVRVRRGGRWRCAHHRAAPPGGPFGRHRDAAG